MTGGLSSNLACKGLVMNELSVDILHELQYIKWLLVVLVLCSLFFTYFFFLMINRMANGENYLGKQVASKKKEMELQELLWIPGTVYLLNNIR